MDDLQHRLTPFRKGDCTYGTILGVTGGRTIHPKRSLVQDYVHMGLVRTDPKPPSA